MRSTHGSGPGPRAVGASEPFPIRSVLMSTSGLSSRFTQQVREAATRHESLGSVLENAQTLYQSLFREGIRDVLVGLGAAEEGVPLLVRLMLEGDSSLQAFPWEALCAPETTVGFLGNSADVFVARGVSSSEPWQPREVCDAVRVLAIAPSAESDLSGLRSALERHIDAGEVEWLEPLQGSRASFSEISDRLRRGRSPHIIHFLGHGDVDARGVPRLRMADADGEEKWIEVELLAQQLKEGFRRSLRLIVLEACEGAMPGALASAAELLVRSGADAVVAHLWPVKTDIARACSRAFYRALLGAASRMGNVAFSLNEARRKVLEDFHNSAEAFSPVLYLRGQDSILFDFRFQQLDPPTRIAERKDDKPPAPCSRFCAGPSRWCWETAGRTSAACRTTSASGSARTSP